MNNSVLYNIVRPVVSVLFKLFFHPKIIGKENIPKNGRIILAGNHKNNLDCIMLMSSTRRPIHFLAKIELWKGPKKIIFNHMGLIPVDRKRKNHESLVEACKYLENEKVIGIFPEGTFNRTTETVMPFKIGAVKMAHDTNSNIVPFIIKGDYNVFNKNLKIIFLSPISIQSDDLDKENIKLQDIVKKGLEE